MMCVREKESWVEVVGGLGHAIGSWWIPLTILFNLKERAARKRRKKKELKVVWFDFHAYDAHCMPFVSCRISGCFSVQSEGSVSWGPLRLMDLVCIISVINNFYIWFWGFATLWLLTPVNHLLQHQDFMKGMKGKEASLISIITICHLNSRKTKRKSTVWSQKLKEIREVDELKHIAIGFSLLVRVVLESLYGYCCFLVLLRPYSI